MKKKLIGALALSAFILLSACTPSSTEPSSVGSNPSSSSASSNIPDPPPKKLTGGSLIDIKMENYAMWPLGLYKNLLIFGSSKPHTSPDGEYLDTEDDFFRRSTAVSVLRVQPGRSPPKNNRQKHRCLCSFSIFCAVQQRRDHSA